jgi:hypothetical protein
MPKHLRFAINVDEARAEVSKLGGSADEVSTNLLLVELPDAVEVADLRASQAANIFIEGPGIYFAVSKHVEITQAAAASFLASGQLTSAEVATIISANTLQDFNQIDSRRHFDNCTFAEGADYIASEWEIGRSSENRHSQIALTSFGRLLHTMQDFYSHSNWVELHVLRAPVPTWDFNVGTLPAEIVSGTWMIGFPKRCRNGAPSHEAINKDAPDTPSGQKVITQGPNRGRSLFDISRDCALRSTHQAFLRFISQ